MKSFRNLMKQNAGPPLVADDVLEFHAARLLLLLRHCGILSKLSRDYRIDGLTKMAKMDFFVRYPAFFQQVLEQTSSKKDVKREPESPMIRYQYGPWDHRYSHVLGYLRSKGLIEVRRVGTAVELALTKSGEDAVAALEAEESYAELIEHMKLVSKAFKQKTGNALKKLIYERFKEEVGELPWGETIQQ